MVTSPVVHEMISDIQTDAEFKPLERKYEVRLTNGQQIALLNLIIEEGVTGVDIAMITKAFVNFFAKPQSDFVEKLDAALTSRHGTSEEDLRRYLAHGLQDKVSADLGMAEVLSRQTT